MNRAFFSCMSVVTTFLFINLFTVMSDFITCFYTTVVSFTEEFLSTCFFVTLPTFLTCFIEHVTTKTFCCF